MTKKAVLVHPDPFARAALRVKLETRYPCLAIAAEAADGTQGHALIRQLNPDFAFVDAGLSGKPSFQIIEKLDAKPIGLSWPAASLIAFAFRACWVEAVGYLLKSPASDAVTGTDQQSQGASRGPALRSGSHNFWSEAYREWLERSILFGDTQKDSAVKLKDLIRIEAQGRKSMVYVAGWPEPVVSLLGISAWAEDLRDVPFLFRSHRSHLINLTHFKQYNKASGLLIMTSHNGENGTKAVLSDSRKAALRQTMVHLGWREIGGRNT